jgi:hypothetical protein
MEETDDLESHITHLEHLRARLINLRGQTKDYSDDEFKDIFMHSLPQSWAPFLQAINAQPDLDYAAVRRQARVQDLYNAAQRTTLSLIARIHSSR